MGRSQVAVKAGCQQKRVAAIKTDLAEVVMVVFFGIAGSDE
jgi:hypothetical protein